MKPSTPTASFFLILSLLPAGPLFAEEAPALPKPSGPYSVGTRTYDWTDTHREETWTPEPDDRRRLVVQLWYPTNATGSAEKAPYVPDLERLKPSMDQYWPRMPAAMTHAIQNASLLANRKKFPVIVFSHGMNASRQFCTALLEELASHGTIVAAIDHTYWGPGVAYSNGTMVRFEDGMIARDKLTPDEITWMMREGIEVMMLDQVFTALQLLTLDQTAGSFLHERLDRQKFAVMGHSMGGMAAERACLQFGIFALAINLDGPVWNRTLTGIQPSPSRKPLLLILSEQFFKEDPEFAQHYAATWENPVVLILNRSRHNQFTDFGMLDPKERKEGSIDPFQAHAIYTGLVLAFLESRWQNNPLPFNQRISDSTHVRSINLESFQQKKDQP